jgi:hypothetical protein
MVDIGLLRHALPPALASAMLLRRDKRQHIASLDFNTHLRELGRLTERIVEVRFACVHCGVGDFATLLP